MGLDNPLHIAFLLVILLLVFGARRLPEIGRSLGSGLREFKQSVTGEGAGHDQEKPSLPAGAPAEPVSPPPPQDAVAQRDPAATDRG
ncbi:MAG TPA: twin-arginine translocase TatA/TatE family subunit [Solirubrobacteraceae bacterium]|jgi:sec-independent protein translocase protein TatA|nr:twin-arginine translocase TatA/TatE family subunit [Solirubrobacteraceae bacterium]